MAFGAEELRVLRRALAAVLYPAPMPEEDVRACLRLAESVDEAVREAGRLRAFLDADLARYRTALPGSLGGYLALLEDALAAGYTPVPDDLAALRANRVATALLERCERIAERTVRERLAGRAVAVPSARRAPLLTLVAAGGDKGGEPAEPRPAKPAPRKPGPAPRKPEPKPAPQSPPSERPVPKPSEVFPPRRKPVPPPQERVAG
jgi:hypothetical protein